MVWRIFAGCIALSGRDGRGYVPHCCNKQSTETTLKGRKQQQHLYTKHLSAHKTSNKQNHDTNMF